MNERVVKAMQAVPRHLFVPEKMKPLAYRNHPLPIGHEQTISQPFIVAYMTELLELEPGMKVLEIGTGSGYQAAVLAELEVEVYSIEIVDALAQAAKKKLHDMNYKNIHVRSGDGYVGWPKAAPFDGIIVTCAPDHIPKPLVEQLKIGGRMVIPVGQPAQELVLVQKTKQGIKIDERMPVRFVPMTGEALKKK